MDAGRPAAAADPAAGPELRARRVAAIAELAAAAEQSGWSERPVRRAATLEGVFPFGLDPSQAGELLATIAARRPAGLERFDLIAAGEEDWA